MKRNIMALTAAALAVVHNPARTYHAANPPKPNKGPVFQASSDQGAGTRRRNEREYKEHLRREALYANRSDK